MSSKTMKILLLPEDTFGYLLHVYEQHLGRGISPDEVFAAADLKVFLGKAQTIDYSKLGKAEIEKLGPNGVALNLKPEPAVTEESLREGFGSSGDGTDNRA